MELSNPAIQKMIKFVESPIEFNKKTESISVCDERDLFWPTNKTEHCYLVKYTVDGDKYIGFTGPVTWSFAGIDFSKMTIDQLYETYCGWFIVFHTINSAEYEKHNEGKDESVIVGQLLINGFSEIKKLQNAFIGGRNYYEFSVTKNEQKFKIVGTIEELQQYPYNYILPFYEYIGIGWNPMDK
jgi:hypothetical protein